MKIYHEPLLTPHGSAPSQVTQRQTPRLPPASNSFLDLRGNHSSHTTCLCLTQVFFKSGEYVGELWRSLTLYKQRMKQPRPY